MSNRTPQTKTVPRSGEVVRGEGAATSGAGYDRYKQGKSRETSKTVELEISCNKWSDTEKSKGKNAVEMKDQKMRLVNNDAS
jgi:hypothetical protein